MPSNSKPARPPLRRTGFWSPLVLLSCSALLGIEESTVQGLCTSEDECAPGYDCLLGQCRNSCSSDRECGVGFRCLKTIGSSACIPINQPCGDACPSGTRCAGEVCRTDCGLDEDCSGGQTCRQGTCVGLDQQHDLPFEMPNGGSGGTTGEGGSGAPGQSGSAGTSGGNPPQLCAPDERDCDGNRIVTCSADGTAFEGGVDCASNETCSAGVCETHQCTPGELFCSAASVRKCAANGLSSEEVESCADDEYCDSAGAECLKGVCAPNLPVCDGARPTLCNSDGSGFEPGGTDCKANEACEDGECIPRLCTPGAKFCTGNAVMSCSANGLASSKIEDCDGLECAAAGNDAACQPTINAIAGTKNAFGFALKDSFMMLPCYETVNFDCLTADVSAGCPNSGSTVYEEKGHIFVEEFKLGGRAGETYRVTLRVNGVVTGKYYQGGTRRDGGNYANIDVAQGSDGWHVGGDAINSNYDMYKITVYSPDKSTEVQRYYLNSYPQASGLESHRTVLLGYDATIDVPGQGWVQYKIVDPNCRAINNCGAGEVVGSTCSAPRKIPNEPNLPIPAMYGGKTTASMNPFTGAQQPWHSQIVHITVKQVVEL
jgi:hypothetical protein